MTGPAAPIMVGSHPRVCAKDGAPVSLMAEPTAQGRFGEFGGRFVPETLVPACQELEAALLASQVPKT